jgi:N-acetylneuraminic acid mutarotase
MPAGMGGAAGAATPAGPARWESLAPIPDPPNMYVGVAAARGFLFVVGGSRTQGNQVVLSPAASVYDPATDKWEKLPDLPRPFWMPNVAGVGDRLFVLGAQAVTDVVEYDFARRVWVARKAMPVMVGRGAAAVGVSGTKILVAGGVMPGQSANMLNTGVRVPDFLAYDTATDTWETLPELALPVGYAVGAVLGREFWVIGGSTDFVRTDQVNAFHLDTRKWSDKPPLPITLSSAAVGVVKGRLFVVGGIASSTGMITPDTLEASPTTGMWRQAGPMKTPRFATGAAVIGDRLYVPAGAANVGGSAIAAVNALEVLIP